MSYRNSAPSSSRYQDRDRPSYASNPEERDPRDHRSTGRDYSRASRSPPRRDEGGSSRPSYHDRDRDDRRGVASGGGRYVDRDAGGYRDRERERDRKPYERPRSDRSGPPSSYSTRRRSPSPRRDRRSSPGRSEPTTMSAARLKGDSKPPPSVLKAEELKREAEEKRQQMQPPDGMEEGVDGEWVEEGEDENGLEEGEEDEMAKMMGFGGFGTSKGKHVSSNDTGDVVIKKQRTWRQYMNRKGGFNRPLDKVK
ncbi:Nucleic acid binding protein [Phaffia rhodozyma]|uniref:Nucleic acid binding protein n=1 Tax=Phaffia rhodozyma TaxID=264483 RepID=A0A0F7SEJ4_PHARH|nr:Nucleic acid binding protein [Phaffia rhodozyma]